MQPSFLCQQLSKPHTKRILRDPFRISGKTSPFLWNQILSGILKIFFADKPAMKRNNLSPRKIFIRIFRFYRIGIFGIRFRIFPVSPRSFRIRVCWIRSCRIRVCRVRSCRIRVCRVRVCQIICVLRLPHSIKINFRTVSDYPAVLYHCPTF